jgi:nucleotide-binding universal stress UspA family protein
MYKIIVPTDFTATSDVAVAYAIMLSKTLNAEVCLLHILGKGKEEAQAQKSLDDQVHHHYVKTAVKPKSKLITGTIFDEIAAVVEAEKGDLVVMGTHGLRGMQHLVGSHALRVITDTKAPFVIVQEGTVFNSGIKRIVLPLDLHKETKQKIKYIGDLAEKFNAKVDIVIPNESDEYLQNQVKRNLAYANDYFDERKIQHVGSVTSRDTKHFVEDLTAYAVNVKADMICILNFADEKIIHAFGSDAEQKVITNSAGIPVMVLSPVTVNLHNTRSLIAQWG